MAAKTRTHGCIGNVGDRTPRVAGATPRGQPLQFRYYNAQLAPPECQAPIDMFGCMVGHVVPPDEKLPASRLDLSRPSPRAARNRAAQSFSRAWESVEARRGRDQAVVVLRPELADLNNPRGELHKHAMEVTLEHIPSLVNTSIAAKAFTLHGSIELPEMRAQQFGDSEDGKAVFPTPRFDMPVAIPPRQNAQAVPDGILPPDSARHDQRTTADRHYTVRQTFPIRKLGPPSRVQDVKRTPRATPRPSNNKDEHSTRKIEYEYKDYSAEPTLPASLKRKEVQKTIRSKLLWGRYEQVGHGKFIERPHPLKVAVAVSRHANLNKDYNKLLKEEIQIDNYIARKFQRIADIAEKEHEKTRTVRERRNTIHDEYEKWQHSVAEKFDAELQREAAQAQERLRLQRIWIAIQAHCTAIRTFSTLFDTSRLKRSQDVSKVKAVVGIQVFIRAKQFAARTKKELEKFALVITLIRPHAYFFIINWRARRRGRMTDLIRTFLTDVLKTNQVKRRISSYIFNVRRLQSAWRNNLHRQRARMLMLSRQWDRAFALLRSKGKVGRLSDFNELEASKFNSTRRNEILLHSNDTGEAATSRHRQSLLLLPGEGFDATQHVQLLSLSAKQRQSQGHSTEVSRTPHPPTSAKRNSKQTHTSIAEPRHPRQGITIAVEDPTSDGFGHAPVDAAVAGAVNFDSLKPAGTRRASKGLTINVDAPAANVGPPKSQRSDYRRSANTSRSNHRDNITSGHSNSSHSPHMHGYLHSPSEWEQRYLDHSTLHVHMTAKELTMLGRIVHYPVIKWQKLRNTFRRQRSEHISNMKQYLVDILQYTSFMEQKRTVEQVILAFAPDEDGGREMARKLLGDMAGSKEPKMPRLKIVIRASEMQSLIVQGLQRLVHTSSQLREEAALAEAALRQQAGLTDASYSQLEHVNHHKPWWICHETYWHKFHADPDDPVATETARDHTTTNPLEASLVPALKRRDTLTRQRSMRGMGVGSGR